MSILIKDMEMPTSCIACLLNFGEKRPEYGLTIYCPYSDGVISWRDKAFNNGRLASCGIVPVPPHGRLIDADELSAKLTTMLSMAFGEGNTAVHFAYRSLGKMVENAPTIIPAEPREEETT